jgi:hypothetical protein
MRRRSAVTRGLTRSSSGCYGHAADRGHAPGAYVARLADVPGRLLEAHLVAAATSHWHRGIESSEGISKLSRTMRQAAGHTVTPLRRYLRLFGAYRTFIYRKFFGNCCLRATKPGSIDVIECVEVPPPSGGTARAPGQGRRPWW